MFIPLYIYEDKNGVRNLSKELDEILGKVVDKFYVIDPKFRPIPSYMSLFCIKSDNSYPYGINSFQQIYDPFNIDDNCLLFITWMEPVPYSIPLYIYKIGNIIYPSLKINSKLTEIDISPIYVLNEKKFEKWNKVPQFRFSNYMGRCIPDPTNGVSIQNCVKHNKNKPQTLLEYLLENRKKQVNFVLKTTIGVTLFFLVFYKIYVMVRYS